MSKNRKVSLVDYRKLYESVQQPQFLNDLILTDPGKNVIDLLFQVSEGDLEYAPICSCQAFHGRQYEGQTCPFCGDLISSDFTSNFLPTNWVRIPSNMPKILHIRWYLILANWAGRLRVGKKGSRDAGKKQKVPIIDFILNPDEELPEDLKPGIHGQGFTYFCEHSDEIIRYLFEEHPKFSKTKKAEDIMKIYEEYREMLIVDRFPLLHPSFHPLHVRGHSKTMDKTADIILPAVLDIANAEFSISRSVVRKNHADREMWKIFSKYAEYVKKIMEFKLGDKQALIRRHNVAARIFWTARGVISPINDRHMGDEIYVPWNIGVFGLQLEIINFLCNRHNYSPTEALRYFFRYVNRYDGLIDDIMKSVIRECSYKGLPAGMGRNPTLLRTNIRLVFIPKIKSNPDDKSINISQRICKGFNADNDGDELYFYFIKEMGIVTFAARMHPKEGILSETSLGVSPWVKPTQEAFIHANQFLHYERDNTRPCLLHL